jgi:hypothetical protein
LQPDYLLLGCDDNPVPVDSVTPTARTAQVYNLRVADDHTYFVGSTSWGFSVWVHNQYHAAPNGDGTWKIVDDAGEFVSGPWTKKGADRHIATLNDDLERLAAGRAEMLDVVDYRPTNPPFENHHGILDVWAAHNIDDYASRGTTTPSIALTDVQHEATNRVFREWLFEKTGRKVGGRVEWSSVSPQEMRQLTERMFDAAGVPEKTRREYYRAFHQYIYRGS